MRLPVTAALLLGFTAPLRAQAPADSLLPSDPAVTVGTLSNGIRYYVRANSRPAKRAELRLVINTGSVLEDEDQRGLAHFVEHMAFNGTTRFKKQALIDYIESIGMRFGADLNASTSFDETIYELQVPTDSLHIVRRGFDILEDWAHGVTFDTTEIRKERGVVLEEWRLGRGAGQRMFDKQIPVLFQGSRYAVRLPIGTPECIRSCPPAALTRFYRDWYRPDLMAVVAVGDFDPRVVEALIRERFGNIQQAGASRPRERVPVPVRAEAEVSIATDPEATNTTVSVYAQRPTGARGTTGAWRADLVEAIASSILNERLYELTQKANPPFIGAGAGRTSLVRTMEAFSFGAAVSDSGVRRGLQAVLTELERAGRHGFTAGELDRTKAEYLRGLEQGYAERDKSESIGFASEYVEHFLTGQAISGIAQEFDRAKAVVPGITLADLNGVARGWLSGAPVILVNAPEKNRAVLPGPTELLGLFAAVKRAEIAPYAESVSSEALVTAALPPAPITAERRDTVLGTREWTLGNGVRVVLKPSDFKADELLFQATSPGGLSLAADSALGSAQLAAQAVALSGVGAFPAIELQKKLAGKAVGISPFVGASEHGLSGRASPKDVETLFQLAYLYFTAPRLDTAAVGAFLGNLRAAIANRSASPGTVFSDTLTVTLTQYHPWARPLNPAVVDSMKPRVAYDFYRARFANAAGFTFFLVGTFDPDSIRPLVERYLGNLPTLGAPDRVRDPGIRPPTGIVERTVRKGIEQKSQTAIVFTGPGRATRQERFALSAVGDILEIRLREELREELGGTYSANVSTSLSRVPKEEFTVFVGFGSAPERVDTLVRAVFAEIDSLVARGPRAADLAKYKETAIRSRETELRQNGWWLQLLTGARRENEDPATRFALEPELARLTPEVIQAAARTYLDKMRYVRVTLLPESVRP
ncbi:MAG: insulinase family protein [Gemmatimonadales bacterium]|nr:insulinase family protein [Gemmatimonadales bacterium]